MEEHLVGGFDPLSVVVKGYESSLQIFCVQKVGLGWVRSFTVREASGEPLCACCRTRQVGRVCGSQRGPRDVEMRAARTTRDEVPRPVSSGLHVTKGRSFVGSRVEQIE